MLSLVSSQVQAEPPQASAEDGSHEDEAAEVQQKQVRLLPYAILNAFGDRLNMVSAAFIQKKTCVVFYF